MEEAKKKSALGRLRGLETGGHLVFPISKMASVKAMCTAYGAQWSRRFRTAIDRKSHTITVTRIY